MATEGHWQIRAAVPGEAAALTRIAKRSKRHWNYPEEYLALWNDVLTVTPEFIQAGYTFVAEARQELLGFVGMKPLGTLAMEVHHFWVLPEHMGRHVGRALWERAILVSQQLGRNCIELDSDPNAEAFYERMGAQCVGTTPSVPAGRLLPRMRFRLDASAT